MSGHHPVDGLSDDPFEPMPFAVTFSTTPGCTIVHVAGELDLSTASLLGAALDSTASTDVARLEIDLGELEFVDVAGSRPLQRAAAMEAAAGRRLRVTGTSMRVRRLLTIIGLADLVDIE